LLINRYISAPEPVDGLLGVTDQEQLAGHRCDIEPIALSGIVGRQKQEKLGLDRVRILKLVDKVMTEAPLQLLTHRRVAANQIASLDKQVEKIEPATTCLQFLVSS
jgi:hypothetical protein